MPTRLWRGSSSSKGTPNRNRLRRCHRPECQGSARIRPRGWYDARASYLLSRDICRDAGDYVTMQLFEALLKDEEGHIDFVETQLGLINDIGIQNYGGN